MQPVRLRSGLPLIRRNGEPLGATETRPAFLIRPFLANVEQPRPFQRRRHPAGEALAPHQLFQRLPMGGPGRIVHLHPAAHGPGRSGRALARWNYAAPYRADFDLAAPRLARVTWQMAVPSIPMQV